MGKHGFFPRLALVNLLRNSRYYGPYLLSCSGMAAMYYILRFLTWNEVIQTVRGAAYLQAMMWIGCYVVSLFSIVILLYANSFVMKRRQRELGLYSVLGMEKRHVARMCFWETLLCAAVTIVGGIAAGILLSKLILLMLLKLVHIPVQFGFSVSGKGILETAELFGVLFVITLAWNLLRVGRSRPVELLRGGSTGEREPRTRRLLTALGILTLLGGYTLALFTQNPVEALGLFFVAVLLVMAGTYCLFTAGSVALLKRLRANRQYYYQTKHFTAVAGLLYRMKQNAVGMANICILSSMVLVTVSGTLCLYLGSEDALNRMFPYDVEVVQDLDRQTQDPAETLAQVREGVADEGEVLGYYTRYAARGFYGGNTLTLAAQAGTLTRLELMTAEDYSRLTGREATLTPAEVLACAQGITLPNTFYIEDLPFQVKERLETPVPRNDTVVISGDQGFLGLVVADQAVVDQINGLDPGRMTRQFRVQLCLDGTEAEKLTCFERLLMASGGRWGGSSRQDNARDIYAMYGGFLFLGIFLGLLFLLVTVLIIYYKQLSEGYEDQRRYQIMQQVGMSRREVRASIRSQILLVFFLPLGAAGLHILMAFQMLCRILELFNLYNVGLFALCTAGTLLAFAAIYALVYGLTARTYYRIVSPA